ncbi:MAG: hypothetical protein AAF268_04710 [Cyanobacteria bacterium P01_A01_bin.3]
MWCLTRVDEAYALHVAAEGEKTVSRFNQSRCSGEGVLVEDPGVMNADSSRFEVEASLGRRSSSEEVPSPLAAVRTVDSGMERSHDPLSRLSSSFQFEQSFPAAVRCFDTSEFAGVPPVEAESDNASESANYLPSPVATAEPSPSLLDSISASPSAIRALKGPSMSLNPVSISAVPISEAPVSETVNGQGIQGANCERLEFGSCASFQCDRPPTIIQTVAEQPTDVAAQFSSPVQEPIPELTSADVRQEIGESSGMYVSRSIEDISRIEGQVINMDDLQVDSTLNPLTEFSSVEASELEALESELFDATPLDNTEDERVATLDVAKPVASTHYGPAVLKDYCAGNSEGLGVPEWMDFQPSLLSEDELAVIYSESLEAMNDLLPDALEEDIVEDAVSAGSEFQLKLAENVAAENVEEEDLGVAPALEESSSTAQTEPYVVDAHSFTPPPLETAHQSAMLEFAEQPEPNRKQEMQTEVHGLRGQIDILELREEKLHLQLGNFVNEIDQLNEQNVLLEKLVQELPDLYRKKFHDRMKPIKERIARIQEENLRLHADIDWLTQKLAANVLPPAPEERRLIKLPSFGRRLPLLPDAVGQ